SYAYTTASFFFFFQAEDGIRDGHVTGVQTCALPISPPDASRDAGLGLRLGMRLVALPIVVDALGALVASVLIRDQEAPVPGAPRSEERRVGKEWRSRRARASGSRRSRSTRLCVYVSQ